MAGRRESVPSAFAMTGDMTGREARRRVRACRCLFKIRPYGKTSLTGQTNDARALGFKSHFAHSLAA